MRDHYPDAPLDAAAEPGVCPVPEAEADAPALTLDVDGEVFEVRRDGRGGTDYTWRSGPDPGYGFGLRPLPEDMSVDDHREVVRRFLAEIDPATGHLRED